MEAAFVRRLERAFSVALIVGPIHHMVAARDRRSAVVGSSHLGPVSAGRIITDEARAMNWRALWIGFIYVSVVAGSAPFVERITPANAQETKTKKSGSSETAALKMRVSQLERQLADMRAMLGTLRSLARSGGGGGASAGGYVGGGDPVVETQIRALTRQVESLMARIDQLERVGPGKRSEFVPGTGERSGVYTNRGDLDLGNSNDAPFSTQTLDSATFDSMSGFETTTLDAKGVVKGDDLPGPSASSGANAKRLYQNAYGHFLKRDYRSAQSAFQQFLRQHPKDRLAGNAQYWLGETYYLRGQYKNAADAYLLAFRKYRDGDKAPDSLMKLAMSLVKLGEAGAACATFNEVRSKFPNAPAHVTQQTRAEQRKAGC